MADPRIGRLINQRYQVIEAIGQGAMGQVYRAKDSLFGGAVAVKFLARTLLSEKMCDRFVREATIANLLGPKSIHIVRVTDYGIEDQDNLPFYVMEYLQGKSLSEIILRQALTLPRFLSLTRQICLGLQCAHQGIPIESEGQISPIVHCDIKPSNILIIQDPSVGELAKILDFGIANVLQSASARPRVFMGTLAYASPEQLEVADLDVRSDIYSLGVMMFQMLSGRLPIQADTHSFAGWYRAHREQSPRSLTTANANLSVPQPLEAMIMSSLAKSPSDRLQSVADIIKVVEPLIDRFNQSDQPAQRSASTFHRIDIHPGPQDTLLFSTENIFKSASWPLNKPAAELCFPQVMRINQGELASLWIKLDAQEIQQRQICTRYNHFLFNEYPHPVLLWLTVLYNHGHEPCWLPIYLDLKSFLGQRMARLMVESGQYRLLFFSTTAPQHCLNVMTAIVPPAQRKLLKGWITRVPPAFSMGQPNPSENRLKSNTKLKDTLEALKPKIQRQLDSLYADADFSD